MHRENCKENMTESNLGKAYFRVRDLNQCELNFVLNFEKENIGKFYENINAVRKSTDTVSSLLQHIKNKVNKIIQDKNKENTEYNIPISLQLLSTNVKGDTVLKDLLNQAGDVLIFEIFNQKYHVIVNAPLVKLLKLPAVLYADFGIEPVKIKTVNTDFKKCKFLWYKSMDKQKWKKVCGTYHYIISSEDIDHYLKLVCIPYNEVNYKGPPFEVISENKVEPIIDIPTCPFEERHTFTIDHLKMPNFRIISYNILSERYTEGNYPYCSEKVLAFDYRKQLIYKELLGYHADIICLQEVDHRHYMKYFKKLFNETGYISYHHKKGNRISEGLAIFHKSFKKISSEQVVLAGVVQKRKQLKYLWDKIQNNADVKELFLKQATSLQITILQLKGTQSYLIVANTHLFYHPDASHIRLLQINIITHFVEATKSDIEKKGGKAYYILCGDFNSRPDSSVYSYIINGQLDPLHEDCLKISDKGDCNLHHKLKLKSACGTPLYTNYTNDFKDCLDYIFIDDENLDVIDTVPLPDESLLSKYEGLPNEVFPSDHLALVANLKIL